MTSTRTSLLLISILLCAGLIACSQTQPSPTPTVAPSYTPTQQPTRTLTPTPSLTPSPTKTSTPSQTPTITNTPTPTSTPLGGALAKIAFISQKDPNDSRFWLAVDQFNDTYLASSLGLEKFINRSTVNFIDLAWVERGEPCGENNAQICRLQIFYGTALNWSPDGKRIAFATEQADGVYLTLYDLEFESINPMFRIPGLKDRQIQNVLWSPDGKWISFYIYNPTGGNALHDVWIVSSDGARAMRAGSAGGDSQWSPDSTFLYFDQKKFFPTTENTEVITMPQIYRTGFKKYIPELDAFVRVFYENTRSPELIEITLFSAITFETIDSVILPGKEALPFVEISPDGKTIILWIIPLSAERDWDNAIATIHNFETGTTLEIPEIRSWRWLPFSSSPLQFIQWTPDRKGIILGLSSYPLLIDLASGETVFLYFPYRGAGDQFSPGLGRHFSIYWQPNSP